jgi:hypothetical protein
MSKLIKIIIGLVIVVPLVIIFFVGVYGGQIAKDSVNTYGPEFLGVDVAVDDVDFSVLGGELSMSGLVIGNPEGFESDYAFALGAIKIELDRDSLFTDHIIIDEVRITAPEVIMELGKGGNNLTKLQETIEAQMGPVTEEEDTEPAPNVTIRNFYLTDASFQLVGLPAGMKSPDVSLPDIHLENIGTGEDDEEGTSFAEASGEIIAVIAASATTAVAEMNLKGLSLDVLKDGGGILSGKKDTLTKIKEGIGGLFKKKKKDEEQPEEEDGG